MVLKKLLYTIKLSNFGPCKLIWDEKYFFKMTMFKRINRNQAITAEYLKLFSWLHLKTVPATVVRKMFEKYKDYIRHV